MNQRGGCSIEKVRIINTDDQTSPLGGIDHLADDVVEALERISRNSPADGREKLGDRSERKRCSGGSSCHPDDLATGGGRSGKPLPGQASLSHACGTGKQHTQAVGGPKPRSYGSHLLVTTDKRPFLDHRHEV